jgi:hypothetical protein
VGEGANTAPGGADDGDGVAGLKGFGFEHKRFLVDGLFPVGSRL